MPAVLARRRVVILAKNGALMGPIGDVLISAATLSRAAMEHVTMRRTVIIATALPHSPPATRTSARPATAMATARSAAASTRICSAVTANAMTGQPRDAVWILGIIYATSTRNAATAHVVTQKTVRHVPQQDCL